MRYGSIISGECMGDWEGLKQCKMMLSKLCMTLKCLSHLILMKTCTLKFSFTEKFKCQLQARLKNY